MRAKLANINDCAVPFLSRATNLCWYNSIFSTDFSDDSSGIRIHQFFKDGLGYAVFPIEYQSV